MILVLLKEIKDHQPISQPALLLSNNFGNLVIKTISVLKPGKTPEEIRKAFQICNQFTPGEEQVKFMLLIFHLNEACLHIGMFQY